MNPTLPHDLDLLIGAVVERADTPARGLIVLRLRTPAAGVFGRARAHLVLGADDHVRGVGLAAERPRGLGITTFGMVLRKHLEGARIERAERTTSRHLEIALATPRGRRLLHVELGLVPNVGLEDDQGRLLGALRAGRPVHAEGEVAPATGGPSLLDEGLRLLPALSEQARRSRRALVVVALRRALSRVERRAEAIASDIDRAERAGELRDRAKLLAPIAASIPSGAGSARVMDWSQDPPAEAEIPLDPSRPARAQVETMFRRARGLERGRQIATERAAAAEVERRILTDLLDAAQRECTSDDELDGLIERARAARVPLPSAEASPELRARRQSRKAFRTFRLSNETQALVGKSASDNDVLTLQVARPSDVWLHARDYSGAHVVVQLDRGRQCASETLLDAAHLAAHFSEARGADRVEIAWTERRHVRKPKGSPAGAVRVERERVVLLRVEPDRLRRLLADEIVAP